MESNINTEYIDNTTSITTTTNETNTTSRLNELIEQRAQVVHHRFDRVKQVETLRKCLYNELSTIKEKYKNSIIEPQEFLRKEKQIITNLLIQLAQLGDKVSKLDPEIFGGLFIKEELITIQYINSKTKELQQEAENSITQLNTLFNQSIDLIISSVPKSLLYKYLFDVLAEISRLKQNEIYYPFNDKADEPINKIIQFITQNTEFNKNILYPIRCN